MSDRTDFLHPDYEPGEFEQVERRLRQALTRDAEQVRPSARLDAILHEAHELGPETATGGSGTRHWLMPLAAAAAVVAIIGGVWWTGHDDEPTITPPQTNGPTLSPAPSPSTSATDTPTTSGPGATQAVSLPVYFTSPIGDAKATLKLFRTYIVRDLPAGATATDKVRAALELAVDTNRSSDTAGSVTLWKEGTIGAVDVSPQRITVDLQYDGAMGFDTEAQRVAVQQLVWTAEAALGKGAVPVKFTLQGKEGKLFGTIPTGQPLTRPSSDESWKDLAPIWVTSPGRNQALSAAKPVTVEGQATVFEATLSWQLLRDDASVKEGNAMATIGAPSRGTYAIPLGALTPGSYTIRVWEVSQHDGTVSAEDSVSFTVK